MKKGTCFIESEGFKHMTKANWPNLNELNFGYYANKSKYPPISEQNQIQLNGSNAFHEIQFKKLKSLLVIEKNAICWLNSVLVQT